MLRKLPKIIGGEPCVTEEDFLPPSRPAVQQPRSRLRWLKSISAALRDLLFPTKCRVCGVLFRSPEKDASTSGEGADFEDAMGPFLCPECREGFLPTASPLCPTCGEVFVSRQGANHLCGACIEAPRKFRKARSVGVYEKGLLKAVHCLKYRGRVELARPLGTLLFAGFLRYWQPGDIDLVMPVPLHGKRMRKRGFNQSLLLVGNWPERMNSAGYAPSDIRIAPELLKRSRATTPQTGLGRRQRMKNLRGAFAVPNPEKVKGKRVLLVDDVYTTGATADGCAAVLRKAGAARVDVLTLARTMGK